MGRSETCEAHKQRYIAACALRKNKLSSVSD